MYVYTYIYTFAYIFAYLFRGGGRAAGRRLGPSEQAAVCVLPASVKKQLLLGEPWPSNPEAETALQPLIWHSEGLSYQGSSSLEDCFFHRRR